MPLAVVIVVACVALAAFALRRSEQPAAPPPLIVHVPVEVPVVQEKVVTELFTATALAIENFTTRNHRCPR